MWWDQEGKETTKLLLLFHFPGLLICLGFASKILFMKLFPICPFCTSAKGSSSTFSPLRTKAVCPRSSILSASSPLLACLARDLMCFLFAFGRLRRRLRREPNPTQQGSPLFLLPSFRMEGSHLKEAQNPGAKSYEAPLTLS